MVWHKNYKLCDFKRCRPTFNTTAYSGKDRKCATPLMTATDATVTGLTAKTENVGYKLYVEKSFQALFDDACTEPINCCGTVRQNRKVMPKSIGQKM